MGNFEFGARLTRRAVSTGSVLRSALLSGARRASRAGAGLALAALALGSLALGSQPSKAAPPAASKAAKSGGLARRVGPAPLTFSVTARISATGITSGPPQTIRAEVALNGAKARVQTKMGAQPVVVLFAPPYIYRLLPSSKAGVRWKLNANTQSSINSFDPQQLLRDPTQMRAALLRGGAKKTGNAQLQGVATEVYEMKGNKQRIQGVKVWLRRADALPVRLVANGPNVQVVASWSSYARPRTLDSALFTPPSTYRIRDAQSAPPLAGL